MYGPLADKKNQDGRGVVVRGSWYPFFRSAGQFFIQMDKKKQLCRPEKLISFLGVYFHWSNDGVSVSLVLAWRSRCPASLNVIPKGTVRNNIESFLSRATHTYQAY